MAGIGIAVAIVVVALIALVGAITSRYKKAGPDEVLVISGRKRTIITPEGKKEVGFRIIRNGGTIVLPVVEKIGRLSLRQMRVDPTTESAMSKDGVKIEVKAIALLKIASDDVGIMNAAERFLGVGSHDIETFVRPVLESNLRSVCGTLTPEEIYRDRDAFQKKIAEHAQADLAQIGIALDTLTLHGIEDKEGYLDALGQKRTAEVKRDARIGKAVADQEATVREAEARKTSQTATAEADANVALAQKERDVKMAKYNADVATEKAKADQAGPRADAEARQEVVRAQTDLAEKEAERKQKELLATVVRPAEAQKAAAIAAAEGEKASRIAKAEAHKQELQLDGEGTADKTKEVGLAEAEIIKAKGVAEGEALKAKADGLAKYNEAGMKLQIAMEMIHTLPDIIKAAVAPLGAVDSVKIVDFGGNGTSGDAAGPMGRLLNLTPKALSVADETLKSTLGMSLAEMLLLVRSGKSPAEIAATRTEKKEEK